jgi:hypothetical protein
MRRAAEGNIEKETVLAGWSKVLVTALRSSGKHREGDPTGWSTVLVTTLGSVLGKPVPRSHTCSRGGLDVGVGPRI